MILKQSGDTFMRRISIAKLAIDQGIFGVAINVLLGGIEKFGATDSENSADAHESLAMAYDLLGSHGLAKRAMFLAMCLRSDEPFMKFLTGKLFPFRGPEPFERRVYSIDPWLIRTYNEAFVAVSRGDYEEARRLAKILKPRGRVEHSRLHPPSFYFREGIEAIGSVLLSKLTEMGADSLPKAELPIADFLVMFELYLRDAPSNPDVMMLLVAASDESRKAVEKILAAPLPRLMNRSGDEGFGYTSDMICAAAECFYLSGHTRAAHEILGRFMSNEYFCHNPGVPERALCDLAMAKSNLGYVEEANFCMRKYALTYGRFGAPAPLVSAFVLSGENAQSPYAPPYESLSEALTDAVSRNEGIIPRTLTGRSRDRCVLMFGRENRVREIVRRLLREDADFLSLANDILCNPYVLSSQKTLIIRTLFDCNVEGRIAVLSDHVGVRADISPYSKRVRHNFWDKLYRDLSIYILLFDSLIEYKADILRQIVRTEELATRAIFADGGKRAGESPDEEFLFNFAIHAYNGMVAQRHNALYLPCGFPQLSSSAYFSDYVDYMVAHLDGATPSTFESR